MIHIGSVSPSKLDFVRSSLQTEEKSDILVVDDSPENLMSMEELLASPEYNLIKAQSGEEALEATLASRPALILLDVQMPNMDGFEVARHLRSTQRTREIPIIFVTATQRDERFSFRGFESGAVDYLLKPLNPVIVRSKVKVFVDLHKHQLRLEKAVHDLYLINQELESFSYSVSHDLRAPLRAILGFTQSVVDELDPRDTRARETLLKAVRAGERMNHLIDGLLDLARTTRASIEKGRVDLSRLATQICLELSQDPSYKKVRFQVADGLVAIGDRRLLESALRNLLSNAFKFSQKTENPFVEFGSQRKGGVLTFYVRDNGVGFDMEYADRLFGVFQRLHNEREFPGTGVGLATVQRIIRRHGGEIWAESRPGEITTFYFTL